MRYQRDDPVVAALCPILLFVGYVCIVITYSRVWINRVSCSWSAEQRKLIQPCPSSRLSIWSRGTGSAVPSRASLLILHTQAESGAYLRDSSLFPRRLRPFMYFKPPCVIGSVPSLSGNAVAYQWRLLPRVRQHRASSSQGSFERVLPFQVSVFMPGLYPTAYRATFPAFLCGWL